MKRKEVLIIFLLAVLVTGASYFKLDAPPCFTRCYTRKGFPLPIWARFSSTAPGESRGQGVDIQGIVLDLLFWFLVLVVGWWVVKKAKTFTITK